MAEGKRPGGLTALAVINFVLGGLGVIGLLVVFAMLGVAHGMTDGKLVEAPGAGAIYLTLFIGVISLALLLASGVGYIQQKRVLGRTFGNAYAISALVNFVISMVAIKSGFGIANMIGLVYPILTLILVNTTFKEDLVN